MLIANSFNSSISKLADNGYLPFPIQVSKLHLVGDRSASILLRCLENLVNLYGVSFILNLYLPFVQNSINLAANFGLDRVDSSSAKSDPKILTKWTIARLVAGLTCLHQFLIYLTDSHLSELLNVSCGLMFIFMKFWIFFLKA